MIHHLQHVPVNSSFGEWGHGGQDEARMERIALFELEAKAGVQMRNYGEHIEVQHKFA